MTSEEEVTRKLDSLWRDPKERGRASAELAKYGQESHAREVMRVRLAVLKLCEGRVDRVAELVAEAKRDYRDVLMWAEYPEEGQALWAVGPNLSEEERARLAELRARDREQYLGWLKK